MDCMIKKRGASILFLTAGLLLLLAYLFFAHFFDLLYRLGGRGEWSAALSTFFSPGYANAPGQWLRAELIKFGIATAGLASLAIAAVQRDGWWTSIGATRSLR